MKLHRWMQKWRYGAVLKKVQAGVAVMDVGCGKQHRFLDLIQDKVHKGYGIDKKIISDEESTIEFIGFDFDNSEKVVFPLPEGTVLDQVFMLAVIEHVYHAENILRGIIDLLSDQGELLITTPTTFSKPVLEFFSYRLHLIDEGEIRDHKHYFSKGEIMEMLERTGFVAIKHKYFQFWMNQLIIARKPSKVRLDNA